MTFFHRTRENNPQIYMEPQKTPKQSLKKNNDVGELKNYCKTTVNKTVLT